MRVLVAPDKFAGTLTAPQATAAIAEGWHRHAPLDELDLAPMADGGPGFVDVLAAVPREPPAELLSATVPGPLGGDVPATVLVAGDTAYVESAQACGLHLVPRDRRDPAHASTRGVGRLVAAALDAGVRRVVVGLGGSGTNDGGAGLLAALGATSEPPGLLDQGPAALARLEAVDLTPARERVGEVELLAASDVDNPLLGLAGATNTYGPQKGVTPEQVQPLDAALERFAAATDKRTALGRGAGAAGGLGFALLLLGAERRPGVRLVADLLELPRRAAAADLVVTGEGAFDFSSRSGKVPYGVAEVAASAARPCIALAGQVLVGSREMRALGVESAYAVVDLVGQERSFSDAAGSLAALAERVARSWSR